jgi:hypothetical protein
LSRRSFAGLFDKIIKIGPVVDSKKLDLYTEF